MRNDGEVVGQDVADSTLSQISQRIGEMIEPRIFPVIEVLEADGVTYIRVVFTGSEAPYSCDGRYRIRRADEDVPMPSNELARAFADCSARTAPWDSRPSGTSTTNVVEGAVRRYVEKGSSRDRITEPYTDAADVLERSGLVVDGDTLTNAGSALFCRGGSPFRLTMGTLAGNTRTNILDLRQEDGPVFDLIDQAEHYIMANIRHRLVFDRGVEREEIPEIPRTAVREALVNAFCHRDYQDVAAVVVDIFTDTVEITNPGLFPAGKTPEDFMAGKARPSRARNPLIAATLYRAGIIEQYGSGIGRIKNACDAAGVRFEYYQEDECTRLVFYRPEVQSESEKTSEPPTTANNRQQPPRTAANRLDTLTQSEALVYEYLAAHGSSSTTAMFQDLGIPTRTLRDVLKRLSTRGIVSSSGADKNRTYTLTDKQP